MFGMVKIVNAVVEFELLTYSFVENALDNSLRYHKTFWALLDFSTPRPKLSQHNNQIMIPYSSNKPNHLVTKSLTFDTHH